MLALISKNLTFNFHFSFHSAFSILNSFKDSLRSLLSPEMTQALLRCKFMEEDVYTIDANEVSLQWLEDGHKRCDDPRSVASTSGQSQERAADNIAGQGI